MCTESLIPCVLEWGFIVLFLEIVHHDRPWSALLYRLILTAIPRVRRAFFSSAFLMPAIGVCSMFHQWAVFREIVSVWDSMVWASLVLPTRVLDRHPHALWILAVTASTVLVLDEMRTHCHDGIHDLLRHASLYGGIIHATRWVLQPPLPSITTSRLMTLVCCALLAPIGLFSGLSLLWDARAFLYTDRIISDPVADLTVRHYLAYITMDLMHAYQDEAAVFPLLEGWIHHGMTGAFALYCLGVRGSRAFLPTLICEVSTLPLCAMRLIPSAPIGRISRMVFPVAFLLTRVVGMILILYRAVSVGYIHPDPGQDPIVWSAFLGFVAMNFYWWIRMMQHRYRRSFH